MTLAAPNVRIAITGEVYRAPFGTAAPTDSTTSLNAAYKGLGYLSEDGVSESWDDTVEEITAWQGATVVRAATTKSSGQLGFTMIETKGLVLETFHRGSTMAEVTPGNFKLEVKPIVATPLSWVFHVIDGAKLIRMHLGNAEVVERGEVTYANGDAIGYPVVVKAYPDSLGNLMTKLANDIAWSAS
jgi:hypothetical protein